MKVRRSILVIINPIAGVRPKDEIPRLVKEVFDPKDFDVHIRYTDYAGHATLLARNATIRRVDTVVAIGGDGTINETARGLVGSSTALGLVPMGSGNGLARHIQIPLEISRALGVIKEGHSEMVDYGTINGRIFFCTAGIGFDAHVSKRFSELKHRGGFNYLQSVFNLMSNFKPSTYVIYTDEGRKREKAFLIAIGNASQWGNNAFITPRASMQDGLMDVTIVKPFNLIEAPQMAVQLFAKNIDTNDRILTLRSSRLHIIMPRKDIVHIDGEPVLMDGVLDIKTIRSGLKVLTPATPSHNLLEPIQYAAEEIHYSIINNLKGMMNGVRKVAEDLSHDVERFKWPTDE